MQFFEFLLIVSTTCYLLFNRTINKKIDRSKVIGMLILVLLSYLIFNGHRWQMTPSYIIWVLALITAQKSRKAPQKTGVRVFKTVGLSLLLIPTILLPLALPVFNLPQPTGPYTVGTKDLLVELDTPETITEDPEDKRSLMVKAWYPSKETNGTQDPYIDTGGRNGFAQKYGLPVSSMQYLDKIDTHVYKDIQIDDATYPVLIFSHGYNSKANGYYALISEIVSHGYIVFAINHTYESTGTTFPFGDEVYFDYEFARKIESGTWEGLQPAIEVFKSDLSFDERHPIVREGLTTYFVKDMVARWATDIVAIDETLDTWNSEGFFKGKLDVSNIGVFGHSRGGGAAGHSLLLESRIKAGANIDGVQWGPIVDTTFQKPFLFLAADWPASHENLNEHAYINKSSTFFYDGMIRNSAHSNFMDIPFMVPFEGLSEAGTIDPSLAIEITNKTVITFFDKHLKNKAVDLNSVAASYEELEINTFKGSAITARQD